MLDEVGERQLGAERFCFLKIIENKYWEESKIILEEISSNREMPRSGARTHNPKTDPNYFTLPGNYNGVKLTSEQSVIM